MSFSRRKINIKQTSEELGFGTKLTNQPIRMLNKDGSFNVKRRGLSTLQRFSFYHYLVTMGWIKFFLLVTVSFVVINLIFTTIYLLIGVEYLTGLIAHNNIEKFLETFFFSSQTFTTVGYGRINPTGVLESGIASFEALTGLLFFAIATGLMYGRFSRPVGKFIFSNNMIISPYKDITALQYRVANKLNHQLIDVEAQISFSIIQEMDSTRVRKFYFLPLELSRVAFFPTSWTINHPIDIKSPLWGLTEEDLINGKAEFLILMKAYDENFAQIINVRTSFTHGEVIWGARWQSMTGEPEDGKTVMYIDKISAYEKMTLPEINVQVEDDATGKPVLQATQTHLPGAKFQA